jgi:hypothetical protein
MTWIKKLYNLFADLGDWLVEKVKNTDNAIIIGILCIFTPLNLIFALSFIAFHNRKGKKRK